MKKSQRFSNMHPENAEEFEWNWDRDLSADDLPYHTQKEGRAESKARRNRRKSARDMQNDEYVED